MKRIILLASVFLSCIAGFAQEDAPISIPAPVHDYSKDTMHTILPAWKYGVLAKLSADGNTPEGQAYVRRTARNWDGVDTNMLVKTITTYGQFVQSYRNQLNQSDGIAADFNNALLFEVFPQAMRHPWVVQQIDQIRKEFERRRQEIKEAGIKLLQEIKKTTELDD